MIDKEIFSSRLKALRNTAYISQESLSSALGMDKSAISMLESADRSVSVDTVIKLCRYFNVSSDYLLGLSDEPMILSKDDSLESAN